MKERRKCLLLGFIEWSQKRTNGGKAAAEELFSEVGTLRCEMKCDGALVAARTTLNQTVDNKPIYEADASRMG